MNVIVAVSIPAVPGVRVPAFLTTGFLRAPVSFARPLMRFAPTDAGHFETIVGSACDADFRLRELEAWSMLLR